MIQKAKENKVIFFIIGVYLSGLVKEVSMLFSYQKQTDYLLLESSNNGYIFLLLLILMILIDGFSVWFMMRRHLAGLWLAILSTVFKRIEEYVVIRLSVDKLDLVKELYINRRQARGLPVDEQMVNEMLSPAVFTLTWGLMGAFSVLLVILLLWKRDYFLQKQDDTIAH